MQWASRKLLIALSLAFLLALPLVAAAAPPAVPQDAEKVVLGYYPMWAQGRGYHVKKSIIENGAIDHLTVVTYAFSNPAPVDGGQVECQLGSPWADYQRTWSADESVDGVAVNEGAALRGNFQQLKRLKSMYPDLKVLLSVGGQAWSSHFSDMAVSAESREAFVESCIDLYIKGNLPEGEAGAGGPGAAAGVFDGIDVDWEYPGACGLSCNFRPEDTQNFTALLAEFREQLDAVDPNLMLTIAAGAKPEHWSNLELAKIEGYLDYMTVMAFDFHGPWDPMTNHGSNLFTNSAEPGDDADKVSGDRAVQAYIDGGIPASKVVMGMPFFARGWGNVNDADNGLFQPAQGPAPSSLAPGVHLFSGIQGLIADGFPRYWDDEAKAPYLFDGSSFWTYDDVQSICYKTSYIRHHDLGGAMFWELSLDTDDGTLVSAIGNGLRQDRGYAYGHCK